MIMEQFACCKHIDRIVPTESLFLGAILYTYTLSNIPIINQITLS